MDTPLTKRPSRKTKGGRTTNTLTLNYQLALFPRLSHGGGAADDDVEATVNETCAKLDESLAAGTAPHIVLDATSTGMISETVKSFTRALALPTFSASYGQEGDIRYTHTHIHTEFYLPRS